MNHKCHTLKKPLFSEDTLRKTGSKLSKSHLSLIVLLLCHQLSPSLIHRWVKSARQQPGGESTTYCLWFWPQQPATCCAGCRMVSWPWWQHLAHPTSSVLWPVWCLHCWPRAAQSSTLSSIYLWTNKWVDNMHVILWRWLNSKSERIWHEQQLYLHSKKDKLQQLKSYKWSIFTYQFKCN